jgi:hypothetical protein
LDSYLHVFGHDLQDVFSIEFKSIIDTMEWTPDENFLICGLRSGQTQFVHLPTQRPLPPLCMTDEATKGRTFAGVAVFGTDLDAFFSFFARSGEVFLTRFFAIFRF